MNNQSCYVDGLTNCCSKIIICRKSEHLKIKNSISLTSLTLRRAVWCLRKGEVKLLLCERFLDRFNGSNVINICCLNIGKLAVSFHCICL